jgi:[ribosomal protein S18]-alanine N-acetyltransferase
MAAEIITIHLTRETQEIAMCAHMMVESDPWITLGITYDQCLTAFDGDCKEIYVLKEGVNIRGFVILQICGTFKGYIQTICMDKESRGKGLGKKLLQFCEDRILKISPNIFICVSSFNTGAIKLYDDLGYKKVGELENFVKQGFTELLLRKTVGPIIGYPIQTR